MLGRCAGLVVALAVSSGAAFGQAGPTPSTSGGAPPAEASDRDGALDETPIGAEAFADEPVVLTPAREGPIGPAQMTFSIATWHIGARSVKDGGSAGETKAVQRDEPAATWRHTFGSERRTARWREIAEAGFAADIMALQGVDSAGAARRLFNARRHHVVVSRQLLARSGPRSTGVAVFRDDAPETTALAYRRQRGVRLAGFRHFLPPEEAGASQGLQVGAIVAFRLRIYGKLLWIASIDLGDACGASDQRPVCVQSGAVLGDFGAWTGRLRDGRAPLIVLGRWPGVVRARLKAQGFTLQHLDGDTRDDCSPAPSGMLLATPATPGALTAELSGKAMPARGHGCAQLGELTVQLHDGEPQAGARGETARRADRR